MKTILSLVATTGLLIGSAAIGYTQQGSTPSGAAQGSTPSGAAEQGRTPSGAAPFGRNLPGQRMQEHGDRDRNGLIVAPGGGGERRVEERDRLRRGRGRG
jgi:hypothetical protein